MNADSSEKKTASARPDTEQTVSNETQAPEDQVLLFPALIGVHRRPSAVPDGLGGRVFRGFLECGGMTPLWSGAEAGCGRWEGVSRRPDTHRSDASSPVSLDRIPPRREACDRSREEPASSTFWPSRKVLRRWSDRSSSSNLTSSLIPWRARCCAIPDHPTCHWSKFSRKLAAQVRLME